ncbi:hypothetical protein NEUTE1DRAFT_129848 [Neurospora tetrasperma FGSC 2508]|uniref:Uncharacterized protein n=1 Tax=Neurospora tetrasperma (strain FGSC 2508 / ATCC MYA-4615 / P0657) TaxID=510951 RepID=F8MN94_NEUT8|nr:uncharacterized protein NEUTE1DRAFT_129848 [Neurospora tetrasperma FGSC 2508]EGO58064.1 hypothetical protein NEUTE1DRAFT_129848 [Neurospora tetrasperma FGSC 2508]EGZ71628.1 hypothetical protein NEUTE2DRAFT_157799 [Neurospora tetrasperma FGSC 2509]
MPYAASFAHSILTLYFFTVKVGDTKPSLVSSQSQQFPAASNAYSRRVSCQLVAISSPRWHLRAFQRVQVSAAYSIMPKRKKKEKTTESLVDVDDSFFTSNSQKSGDIQGVEAGLDEPQVESPRVRRKEMRELRNRYFWKHWVQKHPNYVWNRAGRRDQQRSTINKDGLHTKTNDESVVNYPETEAERRQERVNLWNTWVMNHPTFKHSKFGQLRSTGKIKGDGQASLMRDRANRVGRYFRTLRVGQENNTFLRFQKIPVKDRLMKRLVRKIDFRSAKFGQAYFRRLRVGQIHNDFLKFHKVDLRRPQPGRIYLRSLRLGSDSKFDRFRKILFDADGDLKARRKKERRSSKDLTEDHWKKMTKKTPENIAAEEKEEKLARGIPDHWTIEQWEYITKFPNHRTAEEWKRIRNFSSNLGHKRAIAKAVELETYQISDLVLELDAHDNPFVRPFNADDAAEQTKQWPHLDPDQQEIVRRAISVAETVAESKTKWKSPLLPFDHRRITERDVLSVALLGLVSESTGLQNHPTSESGTHEPSLGFLTMSDLLEIGVPVSYSTNPQRLTHLLLHRIEKAQFPAHQEVNFPPSSLLEALIQSSSFHQLRRIIAPLLHTEEGCFLISQCQDTILAACSSKNGYSVDDEYYVSTVFVFLRTIASRLAMMDLRFEIPADLWPTNYADLFFLECPGLVVAGAKEQDGGSAGQLEKDEEEAQEEGQEPLEKDAD